MKKCCYVLLFLFPFFIIGCVSYPHSCYVSPLDINSHSYHSIPMHVDSIEAASYANLALIAGPSNYQLRDYLYGFQASLHRSNNFGPFQAYYGAGLMLGSYYVNAYKGYPYGRYTVLIGDTVIRISSSNQFFGAIGFSGVINAVIPMGKGFEWRIFGIETSIQREFGNYLNFRKSIKDSATNVLAIANTTKVLGIYTEFIWKTWRHTEYGYKIGLGGSFVTPESYLKDSSVSEPFYFSNTFHVAFSRVSSFIQLNIGNHTASFQTGFNYRLGRR